MRISLLPLVAIALSAQAQTITSFPYATGFEGVVGTLNENFPPGWTAEDLNTPGFGNQGWQIIKNTGLAQNAHTDSTAVHLFANFNEDNDDWFYTPPVQMEAGNVYTFNFWYSVSGLFSSTEALEVKVGNAAAAASMSTTIFSDASITNTAYAQATCTYTATANGDMFFGFHCFSSSTDGFILLVDDVTIGETAVGLEEPARTALQVAPNPAAATVNIIGRSGVANRMELVDANGRIVALAQDTDQLELSGIGNGAYHLKVYFASGRTVQRQLIVAH